MAALHNRQVEPEWRVLRSNLGTMDLDGISLPAMWEALRTLKAYHRATPDLPPVTIVPDVEGLDQLDLFYRQPLKFIGGRKCTDPWRLLMIRTDGTAIPAHGRCYDVPLGNVKDEPLATLWNNGRARHFRQTLKAAGGTLPACSRCCGVIGK